MRVTILGCGGSMGVPRLGGPGGAGEWGACDPANPKNRRRRSSLLVQHGGTTVLIDTSPDLREQLLDARVGRLDAVLMTHIHADQTHGIDDLRPISYAMRQRIDLHADASTLGQLAARFSYCFATPEGSSYPPILTGHAIPEPFQPFEIAGPGGALTVQAFGQAHGDIRSLGFRIGKLAYSSDVHDLDDAAWAALAGTELWIVDALRHKPHPSHANVETALGWIARLKPRRAILTDMNYELDYATLRRELPPGVEPGHDGMVVEL
jgi:phosphoribosyl 1,2-cyclic phosphate phosphodiesterase